MDKTKIEHLLTRGVEDVIDRKHLEAALASGKSLRVKHGIDPTGEKIHIGRAVVLWKLREFQELGHKVVIIIGDFTALIGDPSDKLEKRPFLTKVQVEKNMKDYLKQIGKILDLKKTEVRYNSEWLSKLKFEEVSHLADVFTVQQMLERRNFSDRLRKNQDVGLRELLYPTMQGYDSVAVKADVELGGTDQLFNLLAGRKVQERYGEKPQDIMTMQMLEGLDGRKMSTSWGNVINISDSPEEQFGKVMSVHDDLMIKYFQLATDVGEREWKDAKKSKTKNPKEVKMHLAFEIVKRYHGEAVARRASEGFEKLFSKRDLSSANIPELKISSKKISILDLVLASGVVKSKSEARRLIEQGGVSIDGASEKNSAAILNLRGGEAVRIGKKHFFRIKI